MSHKKWPVEFFRKNGDDTRKNSTTYELNFFSRSRILGTLLNSKIVCFVYQSSNFEVHQRQKPMNHLHALWIMQSTKIHISIKA